MRENTVGRDERKRLSGSLSDRHRLTVLCWPFRVVLVYWSSIDHGSHDRVERPPHPSSSCEPHHKFSTAVYLSLNLCSWAHPSIPRSLYSSNAQLQHVMLANAESFSYSRILSVLLERRLLFL